MTPADAPHAVAAPTPPRTDDGPLRILLVSDYYPPFIGGVQRQIQLLAAELTDRGHHVEVATVWSPGTAARERDGAVEVHRLRQLRSAVPRLARPGKHHPPSFPDPVMTAGLRRVVRSARPDVVHAYGWTAFSAAAALVGTGVPLVVSARDYAYGCPTRTLLRDGAPCAGPELRTCLGCAARYYGGSKGAVAVAGVAASVPLLAQRIAGLHSISTYVRDIVRRDLLDDRRTGIPHAIIPSFRRAEDEAAAHAELVAPYVAQLPTEPFLMFAGALRLEKGLEPLLAAYGDLGDAPPLVLIGTAEADTPTHFPPGVVVLHDFPHPAVMAAWQRCLFGVVPSLWPEPLGSVVYEGMSAGRAMIGTRPGGHEDMIRHGETGFLVPAGDVFALRDAMRRLIDDPALRTAMGARAREAAHAYTADATLPRFVDLYWRTIAHAAGRP